MDQYPTPLFAYDEQFRIVDANSGAERITGRSRAELIGMNGIDLVHPDEHALAAGSVDVILDDPTRAIREGAVLRILHADGSLLPWDVCLEVLQNSADGAKYLGVLTPARKAVAMDALIDSLVASDGLDVLLQRVLAATESTGNYAASVHHSHGFAGAKSLPIVIDTGIASVIDLSSNLIHTAIEKACTAGQPSHVHFDRLGLPKEVQFRQLKLRGASIHPFAVRGVVAGALVAWASPSDALGPYGMAIVTRIALLTGLLIERHFDLRSTASLRQAGPISVDLVGQTVTCEGRVAKLTPIETAIMGLLTEIPGRPVSREQIVRRLFGSTHIGDSRAIDVHVRNLRVKLHDEPGNPRFIRTVRGVGYVLLR